MRTISGGQAARLLGINTRILVKWRKRGLLPMVPPRGQGTQAAYSLWDVVLVLLGRDMSRRGLPAKHVMPVLNWCRGRTMEYLEACWRDGRVFLFAVGDRVIAGRLLTHAEVFENEAVDLAEAARHGVPMAIIDVRLAHQKIVDRLHEMELADAAEEAPRQPD